MNKCLITNIKIFLVVLPIINLIMFTVSLVLLIISLNPGVKWNEYKDEIVRGMYMYYFNTLWSSLDANSYEGRVNSGNYTRILNPHNDERWKTPIKMKLYMEIGLVSGSLLLQTVAIVIHSVSKQKLFVVIINVFAIGLGAVGGYFDLKACRDYKNGLSGAISSSVKPFYHLNKEKMLIGYNLAKFGAVLTILGSVFILLYISLYIPFGDGKWIWQKNTEVLPTTDKARSGKLSDAVIRRIQQNIYKEKPLESVRTKVKIITVQEFNKS